MTTEFQVSTREAAAALGVSVRTVQRWAQNGKLNADKTGGRWVITLDVPQAADYKPAQIEKARELVEQAAIVPTSAHGTFAAISSDGDTWYPVTTTTCGCKAGQRGVRCYHRLAAAIVTAVPLRLAA